MPNGQNAGMQRSPAFTLTRSRRRSAARSRPGPGPIAFGAPAEMPALNHVLFGMNAHVNFDLPQALLAVITDDEFDEPAVIARREADHRNIDRVLASRVTAEDDVLIGISGPGSRLNRLLRPLNELGSRRFLREAREKVWANAFVLSRARKQGQRGLRRCPVRAVGPQRRQGRGASGHRSGAAEAGRHRLRRPPPYDVPDRDIPLIGPPNVHNGVAADGSAFYRKAQA